ncbi:hypothetical protein [Peribacillus sp. Hz7]|uniref:hypothetical protein n=1 Tax=Peribacillus sp. Hz7 TaxID=3344873 RepID=UPI0035CAC922
MKKNENIFEYINAKEKELKLNNLFTTEELIQLTNDSLNKNLKKYTNNHTQAIDRTIDDLYLMYTESVKTRYILVAVCTYKLLKITASNLFLPFQDSQLSKEKKKKTKSVLTFFNDLTNIQMENAISNASQDSNRDDNEVLKSEYMVKLVNELLFLSPVKMSKSFKELNEQILQIID